MKNFAKRILFSALILSFAVLLGYYITASIGQVHGPLYIRAAIVYEGEIDLRYHIVPEAIDEAASSFIGDPVLIGHEWSNPNATIGRIVDAAARYDEKLGLRYIEAILEIRDSSVIWRIKRGLYRSLSMGFAAERVVCSIDGKNMRTCLHYPGRAYRVGNQYIYPRGTLYDFDGKEVSFVNIPASVHAQVLEWSSSRLLISESN